MRTLVMLAAMAASVAFCDTVQKAQKGDLFDDSPVVTNVDTSAFQPAGRYLTQPEGGTVAFTKDSISVTNDATATAVTIENVDGTRPALRGEHVYTFPDADGEVALSGVNAVSPAEVTNVVNRVKREYYDETLRVNWTLLPDNGEFMAIATTNTNQEVLQ